MFPKRYFRLRVNKFFYYTYRLQNVQNQYERRGYSDNQLKQVVDWINVNTDADAVFAGKNLPCVDNN